jgi:hypothetical protein
MPHPRRLPLVTPLLASAIATLLSGCAVTFVPGGTVDAGRPTVPTEVVRPDPTRPDAGRPVVSAALPDRGSILEVDVDPNSISPGSLMRFRVRIARPGYLTVSAMAPNDRVEVLLHNVAVVPGQQFVPALDATANERLRASAPTGTWIVRVQYSEVRTPARYQNVRGYDAWTAAVATDLRGVAGASLFETRYEVE